MLVLGENNREWKGRQTSSQILERDAGGRLGFHPQIYRGDFVAAVDDPARSAQICAAVDALFVNSAYETVTQDEKAYVQGQLRQLGDVSLMANAIVAAVLFFALHLPWYIFLLPAVIGIVSSAAWGGDSRRSGRRR